MWKTAALTIAGCNHDNHGKLVNNKMTNTQQIKELQAEREELLKKITTHETTIDLGDETGAAEDVEADEAEEYSNNLALIQTMKDRLAEIDIELSKLLAK
jgi:RNA polymerase-binding transcription factor DksA